MKEVIPLIPLTPESPLVEIPFLPREKGPALPVRTHEFLGRIFPPKEDVLIQRKDGRCNWTVVQIVQYGKQGSGKSEFAHWIYAQAIEKYGGDNVEGWISKGDLKALLELPFQKPVIILCNDDATLEKLDAETVQVLTRIRHICQERTGMDTGLVIVIVGLHRFHASNPLMRTNMDVLVVRTPPANLYDRDVIRQYVGPSGLATLEEIETLRRHSREAYGMAVFANPYSMLKGIVVSGLSDKRLREVETKTDQGNSENEPTDSWEVVKMRSWEDKEFLYEILHELKDVSMQNRAVFSEYLEGVSSEELAMKYKVSRRRIHYIIKDVREKAQGYAAEEAYAKRHRSWEHYGGNSPMPDFIDHENKIVVSFKAYADPDITPTTKWIAKRVGEQEKRYALEKGYALQMHVYEITKRFFIVMELAPPKTMIPDPTFSRINRPEDRGKWGRAHQGDGDEDEGMKVGVGMEGDITK